MGKTLLFLLFFANYIFIYIYIYISRISHNLDEIHLVEYFKTFKPRAAKGQINKPRTNKHHLIG